MNHRTENQQRNSMNELKVSSSNRSTKLINLYLDVLLLKKKKTQITEIRNKNGDITILQK